MHVARWGNSLAVRIPVAVVQALSLKDGDEVDVVVRGRRFEIDRKIDHVAALDDIRRLARPLPAGWKFSRDELYETGFDEG